MGDGDTIGGGFVKILADAATDDRADNRTKHTKYGVALRIGLAPLRVAGGDVANFVAQHRGQFRFVIH